MIMWHLANFMMFWFQEGDSGSGGSEVAVAAGGMLFFVVFMGIFAVCIASMWKIFTKAGEPGWASLVPIYNLVVLLKIIDRPAWWILLMMIPFVNFFVMILLVSELSKKFGQGTGFTIGMIVLPVVFYPMLAFGDARYQR